LRFPRAEQPRSVQARSSGRFAVTLVILGPAGDAPELSPVARTITAAGWPASPTSCATSRRPAISRARSRSGQGRLWRDDDAQLLAATFQLR